MSIVIDSRPLMRQLAKMAGVEAGRFRRMVLVLDVMDAPKLYTEGFVTSEEALVNTPLEVSDEPIVIDTTTMQNEKWKTKQPLESE